jgi:hypothetical protein
MLRAHGEGMDARSRAMQEQLPNAQEQRDGQDARMLRAHECAETARWTPKSGHPLSASRQK